MARQVWVQLLERGEEVPELLDRGVPALFASSAEVCALVCAAAQRDDVWSPRERCEAERRVRGGVLEVYVFSMMCTHMRRVFDDVHPY